MAIEVTLPPMEVGPLSSLNTDKFKVSNLRFPSDLGSSRRLHWINFDILEIDKSDITKNLSTIASTQNNTENLNSKVSSDNSFVGNVVKNVVNSFVSVFGSTDTTAGNIGQQATGLAAKEIHQFIDFVTTPPKSKSLGSISLFMTDSISFNQKSIYNTQSLTEFFGAPGLVTQTVESILNSGDASTAIKSIGQGASETIFKKNPNVLLTTNNQALNPQAEVLFTTIDFRTFQFDFILTPKNVDESIMIQDIIQTFKKHSAPTIQTNKRYFGVPNQFNIKFYFGDTENITIPKIQTCVLTSIFVDYAPQGWVAHNDGSPVQTRLTLQFQETQILDRDKIEKEGY